MKCRNERTPSALRIRETGRMASIEWPPRAKKSSSAPTRVSPSTSANSAHTISSQAVRGATAAVAVVCGAGRDRRSSLPLAVIGRESRTMTDEGTMKSGRVRRAKLVRAAVSTPPPGSAGTT
ncbi:hypothetical protein AMK16_00040 [Streptomyces sp. CB00455]|nr:hypothetical protein AMK16_00040 [Streptomyces sp. CB00455]